MRIFRGSIWETPISHHGQAGASADTQHLLGPSTTGHPKKGHCCLTAGQIRTRRGRKAEKITLNALVARRLIPLENSPTAAAPHPPPSSTSKTTQGLAAICFVGISLFCMLVFALPLFCLCCVFFFVLSKPAPDKEWGPKVLQQFVKGGGQYWAQCWAYQAVLGPGPPERDVGVWRCRTKKQRNACNDDGDGGGGGDVNGDGGGDDDDECDGTELKNKGTLAVNTQDQLWLSS